MIDSRSTNRTVYRRIPDESIVTGAAVELDIHPASPLVRIAATFTDIGLGILASIVFVRVFFFHLDNASQSLTRTLFIALFVTLALIIPFCVELCTRGSSLGKWAFGLRVVRDDGGVITARHVAMRTLVGLMDVWISFGALALISAIVSPRGKRLGDFAAGTIVVAEPESYAYPPILMPPDLAQWASTAQILPISSELHREVLGFLRTNRILQPAMRSQAAESLAQRVSTSVAPLPPQGTHPERFLAAVLVVLRDRECQRLWQQEKSAQQRRAHAMRTPFNVS
ncbi:RDD family protein [Schaalia sp. lx-100]|uniref:RDD family protein n=1 Tax=Schaalia sp. lx-100 TaxID=2899081 RepID=UPI001E3E6916|nr:RDD family protein [Schaalia sp. lx-100]MCD4556749.1 RDD family protein [Schaalia sp. lx-100]